MSLPLTMIVTAYQRPSELARALESIESQSARPARIIVVDDCSQPPLPIRSEPMDGVPMTVIRHEINRGPAAARRTGLLAAETEWISFLDCDDRLLPGSLAERWNHLVGHAATRRPLTIYGCGWIDEEPGSNRWVGRIPLESDDVLAYASGCWFSPGSCIIMNRAAVLEAGVLPDDRLRRLEDLDWFLALARQGARLSVMRKPAVLIERRRTLNPDMVGAASEAILQKWAALALDRPTFTRMAAYLDLERAAANYYAGRRISALGFLARSLARVPRTSLQLSPGWETFEVKPPV